MQLHKLLTYFETSPAVRLLRSPNAPFIVDFLEGQFKRAGRLTVGHGDLLSALCAYREEQQEIYPDVLRDKPESYLAAWCSSETRWLKRLLEADRDEPVYQLTPHTEEAFSFLDDALSKELGFVGTESRLKLVIQMLDQLVVGASDDPQVRLAALRKQRDELDREIAAIEADGAVDRFRPTQIREQFAEAVKALKHLQGDFRLVEERFKEITLQVQRRQSEGRDTRGGILEFALDAEDVLNEEDQGVSFREFVRFILSPEEQDRLQEIIRQLHRIEELADQHDGLETVRRMVPLLMAEADKVMRTNHRLSATLRRLLDAQISGGRRRIAHVLREIRATAVELADDPPSDEVGVAIDAGVAIAAPFSRTFWNEPARFDAVDLTEFAVDEDLRIEAFRDLAAMHRLDWRTMRTAVDVAVGRHGSVSLAELLAEHPPEAGVVEVLGYLQIASDDGHLIEPDATQRIVLPATASDPRCVEITAPLVTFVIGREARAGV